MNESRQKESQSASWLIVELLIGRCIFFNHDHEIYLEDVQFNLNYPLAIVNQSYQF